MIFALDRILPGSKFRQIIAGSFFVIFTRWSSVGRCGHSHLKKISLSARLSLFCWTSCTSALMMPPWWNGTCLPADRYIPRNSKRMYYVYVMSSKKRNYIYVGLTDNPQRRIQEHNNKKEKTTRAYSPFQVLLIEEFPDRELARKREKKLKSGEGKEILKIRALFSRI